MRKRTNRKARRVRALAWEDAKRKRYADPRVALAMRKAGLLGARQQHKFLQQQEDDHEGAH